MYREVEEIQTVITTEQKYDGVIFVYFGYDGRRKLIGSIVLLEISEDEVDHAYQFGGRAYLSLEKAVSYVVESFWNDTLGKRAF